MLHYMDCEFNEFGGQLISMGIVREDNESLYLVYPMHEKPGEWVSKNVLPILWDIPSPLPGMAHKLNTHEEGAHILANFFRNDNAPHIITDWPDDIKYFCQAVITGPGEMVAIRRISFEMIRGIPVYMDGYAPPIAGAVRHNAWWDAKCMKEVLQPSK